LLLLPAELRLQIYNHFFSSTPFTYGKLNQMAPASNHLAILRSCRLINREIDDSWLGQVLFAFENVTDLLNQLSPAPRRMIEQIRRVRVGSSPLTQSIGDGQETTYKLPWALDLIPGLYLDTLTVINTDGPELAYENVNYLIRFGSGWRELHFITGNSEMLAFPRRSIEHNETTQFQWRDPQPSTWIRDLAFRDHVHSDAFVKIYRSTQSNAPGSVMDPNSREVFEQKPPSPENSEFFGIDKDAQLMHPDEIGKELLVIVRRGKDVDISADE
ncbi:hypothetical protein P170DRAFT_326501, partial [Aspergillus steynii IBT 23096]